MADEKLEEMCSYFDKRAETYDEKIREEPELCEFYRLIAECIPCALKRPRILDLGCGTGIELEYIFEKFPAAVVTGIDLSEKMLETLFYKLKRKKNQLKLICQSFFESELCEGGFDCAVSAYSLHHFSAEKKLGLYRKIYSALENGGIYVVGDLYAKTPEEQQRRIAHSLEIQKENTVEEGFYHYDIPLTTEAKMDLLREAGFKDVKVIRQWENSNILACAK